MLVACLLRFCPAVATIFLSPMVNLSATPLVQIMDTSINL